MINEYLEDEYPYPPLMPKDSEGAREHDSWRTCGTATSTLLVDNSIASFENPRRKEIRKSLSKRGLRLPNASIDLKELEGREYLAGAFSLGDIAFIPNIDTLDRIQVEVDPKYKNIHAWIARLKARPSFAASAT